MKNKRLLVFIISFVIWGNALCQLAVFQDDDAIVTPCFNRDDIRSGKISEIVMHYFTKPDGAFINDDETIKRYFFDTSGRITGWIYTIIKENYDAYDTIKCKYYYDGFGNITIKRTETGDFFDTWYYKWNNDHRVQTEVHVQETNAINTDGDFKIATQKVISKDSFAYISYPKQLQKYAYNEDNKIFQTTITQYDDNKRFLSCNCQYAVGWLRSQVDINYDASGKIIGYENSGNLTGEDIKQSTTIKYDSLGNITEEDIGVNGKQKHLVEYMYDKNTGFISDKLDRDYDKALISIIRFSYEVYGDEDYSGVAR